MFRYGGEFTRYTRDMDTARVMGLADYKQKLEEIEIFSPPTFLGRSFKGVFFS